MNDKHNSEGQTKSKFKFLTTNSETRRSAKPSYLYKLPKEQARAVFMARTRMIEVKTNYKNMYTNTICRVCGLKEETQQHVLEECTSIHTQDNLKTPNNQLFSNDPTTTKSTANKLNNPIKNHKRMGTSIACYNRARRPGAPGNTHAKRKKRSEVGVTQ